LALLELMEQDLEAEELLEVAQADGLLDPLALLELMEQDLETEELLEMEQADGLVGLV
jgi:hypothetical protein